MNDEKIIELIAAIEGVETEEKNRNKDTFNKLFQPIYEKLKEGAKQKVIIQILSDQGFDVSAATFRKFFEAECALRGVKIDKTKKGVARYRS